MTKAIFSLSYAVETEQQTVPEVNERLNRELAGRIKDLVARELAGLEFDLSEQYWLLQVEDGEDPARPRSTQTIPLWSKEDGQGQFVEVRIGSPDWFSLIEEEGKFIYRYDDLTFTVRFEARKSRGKTYHYWRAYATVSSKLRTRQIGKTEDLTKEKLDETGQYFLQLREA